MKISKFCLFLKSSSSNSIFLTGELEESSSDRQGYIYYLLCVLQLCFFEKGTLTSIENLRKVILTGVFGVNKFSSSNKESEDFDTSIRLYDRQKLFKKQDKQIRQKTSPNHQVGFPIFHSLCWHAGHFDLTTNQSSIYCTLLLSVFRWVIKSMVKPNYSRKRN